MSRGVPPRKNRFWPPGCQRKILLAFLLVVPFFNVLNSLRIIPKSQDDVWPQLEAKALKNYSQKQQRYSPTFLWGIPSTEDEAGRRQVVRETYLSFYKETNEPNRICALTDLQNHIIPFEDCQIAYVFFLGGNPNGPTELVKPNASFPIVMDTSKDEQDVVFLNIKENLEDGKSQTWLKYASMVHQEFPFDYVTKVDSDTIVFTPAFLQFAENSIPHRPNNELIYGGIPHTRSSCDPWINDTHPCPLELVGDVYMGGAFYWMSLDLASFVTSDALDRSSLTIRHEDVDIGNFVFSHKKTVKTIRVKPDNVLIHRLVDGDWGLRDKAYTFREVYWGHSESGFWPGPFFKREHHFRKMWRQFQAYWFSNKTLYTKDIYQLFDLPYNDSKDLIRINDYIYSKSDFDSSPIVLESHKLIFFTVAGVGDATWRRLFRRVMGFSDWKNVSRKFEGLRYLYDYNVSKATAMMTSPEYTRAIFVRDPKSRILSNYLEHVVKDNGEFVLWGDCCSGKEKCRKRFMQFESFLNVIQTCDEPFWRPQSWKMEPKYYPYLNFVGHYATIQEDTQRLLEKISAWDYGSSGWGKSSKQSIFYKTPVVTNATFEEYYTSDEIEKKAQKCFKVDYDNKLLGLSRRVRFEEHKAIPGSVVQKMLASNNTPSFLWGIASVEGEEETRKMVRETYLSFYQDTDEPNRICTLADIQSRKVPFEDCQIAYTFFLGGNPDGPTELLKPNSSFPMTIAYPPTDEDDVIYLNIKENMEDGKSQTWLKYASIVAEDFPFDYVAKIDSDTLLFTPAFLEFAKETLPARPNNALIYGGFPHSKGSCDPKVNDTHTCPLPLIGSVYMGGALYWMSNDLASFVTSDAVDRKAITIGHEDIDIGNFIFSHSNKVKAVAVEGNKILIHPEYDADWKHRVRTTTFDGVLWGHTENNLWPGPFFKSQYNFRKIWREFQAFWLSGKVLNTYDVYRLFDLPTTTQKDLIRANDYIYSKSDFDSSPIVLESHKLIFFTVAHVGDTTWRRLFRRMMGYSDWKNITMQFEGLTHLYDYNVTEATAMMTSPAYTRAIFVRDPKIRVLSSYLKNVITDEGAYIRDACCGFAQWCVDPILKSFSKFLDMIETCDKPFWRPQGQKMEPRYYKLLNFLGRYENAESDARRLLERIGAWDEYGSGWGTASDENIFYKTQKLESKTVQKYFKKPMKKRVHQLYQVDYSYPAFNFTMDLLRD